MNGCVRKVGFMKYLLVFIVVFGLAGCKSYNVDVVKPVAGTFRVLTGKTIQSMSLKSGVDQGAFVRFTVPSNGVVSVEYVEEGADASGFKGTRFAGWASPISCTSYGERCSLYDVRENLTVEANVLRNEPHPMEVVSAEGNGRVVFVASEWAGTTFGVMDSPAAEDFQPAPCPGKPECMIFHYPNEPFPSLSKIWVRAIPAPGYTLDRWSDNCEPNAKYRHICWKNLYGDSVVRAYFRPLLPGEQQQIQDIGVKDKAWAWVMGTGRGYAGKFYDRFTGGYFPGSLNVGETYYPVSDLSDLAKYNDFIIQESAKVSIELGDGAKLADIGAIPLVTTLELNARSREVDGGQVFSPVNYDRLPERGPAIDTTNMPVMPYTRSLVLNNESSSPAFLNGQLLSRFPGLNRLEWMPNLHTSLKDGSVRMAALSSMPYLATLKVNAVSLSAEFFQDVALSSAKTLVINEYVRSLTGEPRVWDRALSRDVSPLEGMRFSRLSLNASASQLEALATSRPASEPWLLHVFSGEWTDKTVLPNNVADLREAHLAFGWEVNTYDW